jgi:WD40 repeat protein
MRILDAHQRAVVALDYSRDGRLLASAGWDGLVYVWEVGTGRKLAALNLGHQAALTVAFATARPMLAASFRTFERPGGAVGVFHLLSASRPDEALLPYRLWQCEAECRSLAFLAGDQTVLAADAPDRVRLWDLLHFRPVRQWLCTGRVYSMSLHPATQRLAVQLHASGALKVFSLHAKQVVAELTHAHGRGHLVRFRPDGRQLAVAWGATVGLWSGQPGAEPVLLPHDETVLALAYRPDGKTLYTAGHDGLIWSWDCHSGQVLADPLDWQLDTLHALAVAPDGLTAAVATNTGQIVIWDLED